MANRQFRFPFRPHPKPRPIASPPWRNGLTSLPLMLASIVIALPIAAAQDETSRREPTQVPVSLETIELAVAELETLKDLDEELLAQVKNIYTKATQDLTQAAEFAQARAEFSQMVQQAPEDIAAAEEQRAEKMDSVERIDLPEQANAEQIEAKLRNLSAKLATAEATQKELAAEPARREQRLEQLPDEVATAEAKLETARKQLDVPAIASDPEPLSNARVIGAKTAVERLTQLTGSLRSEQEAYLATAELLAIEKELQTRKVKLLTQQINKLKKRLDNTRQQEIEVLAEETKTQANRTFEELKPFAQENLDLTKELGETAKRDTRARDAAADAKAALVKLGKDLETTKRRTQDTDTNLSETMGVMLRRDKIELSTRRDQFRKFNTLDNAVKVRIEQYQHQDELAELEDPAAAAEAALDELARKSPGNIDENRRKILRKPLTKLLSSRKELLTQLTGLKTSLIKELTELELAQRNYATTSDEYTTLINEHILWIRSAPPIGSGDVSAWPASIGWLTAPGNWLAAGTALTNAFVKNLPRALPWALFAAAMLLLHPIMSRKIYEAGQLAEKRSCRDFTPTGRTLLRTLVKTLMWPLLMYVTGRLLVLGAQLNINTFPHALGTALTQAAILLLPVEFLRQVCRGKGLAEAHSEWHPVTCKALKRDLDRYIPFAAILLTVVLTLSKHGVDSWNNTLGRILLVALLAASSLVLYRMMRPGGLFFQRDHDGEGKTSAWSMQLGYLRLILLPGVPLVLMIFALAGYNYTTIELGKVWNETLAVAIGMLVLYAVAMRFLLVRRRRLRYDQLIEQREQQRKAAEEADLSGGEAPATALPIELKTESGLDITDVSRQAREMTGVLFGVIGVFIFWNLWQDLLPATKIFDSWQLWEVATGENGEKIEYVTFRDLMVSLLLFGLTFLGVRNIPGLLELLLLKQLPLDSGSRYAISTIVRYIITVAGVILALSFLKISWTKYSWLVAAISVGLGFGLQEIVANFVSGLILLLERPVRVGDVVTIDGTTGVVSRIQMRATTVTNWDNQELVVPNKDLITGKLMNWTLSSVVNRISIKVGVSYGTDPDQVKDILVNVAAGNSDVLDDPEPFVAFEEFGDSSLNFTLRCCITSISRRFKILHNLNTSIYRDLTDAGIQIPFPQRDLNFNLPDGLELTAKSGSKDE